MDEERPFGEKYVLTRKLAEGGMAELYVARQMGLGGFQKELVIKRILPELADNERYVEMLLSEARIAADLNHPNIVHIYDIGHAEGTYYIAMEYIDGADLMDICKYGVKRSMFLPVEHALKIISQVSEALIYAHSRTDEYGEPMGIVHRDVSPSNILVTYDGVAKLVDFGIAKANIAAGQEGEGTAGKANYMAPEQIIGEDVDHRADLFALGVVLYEITVGRRLFRGKAHEVTRRILEEPIQPPSFVRKDFPVDLEQVVMRALQRRPEDRYQTADELYQDLEDFLVAGSMRTGTMRIAYYLRDLYNIEAPLPAGAEDLMEEELDEQDLDRPRHEAVFDEDFGEDKQPLIFASRLPSTLSPSVAEEETPPDETPKAVDSLPEEPPDAVEPEAQQEPAAETVARPASRPREKKKGLPVVVWVLLSAAALVGVVFLAWRFWPAKKPSRKTPAAPKAAGLEVTIKSRPKEAKIRVDGEAQGVTPARIRLSPEKHLLELRLPGKSPWKWRWDLSGPKPEPSIEALLSLREARLDLKTTPAGLVVLVDGHPEGRTPALLRDMVPGRKYHLVICGRQWMQTIHYVAESGTTTMKLKPNRLPRSFHAVRVISRPKRARVSLDGKSVGRAPVRVRMQAGTVHRLKFAWGRGRNREQERHVCFKRPPNRIRVARRRAKSKSSTLELKLNLACTVVLDRAVKGPPARSFTLKRLAPGEHSLLIKSQDPPLWHLTEINLKAGKNLTMELEFTPQGLGPLIKTFKTTKSP
jgi:serine/threonine protein kinase